MSCLPLLTIEEAPEETRSSLKFVEDKTGYVPVTLESYLTVSRINVRGSLSVAERETVQIIAAATRGCAFCVAGHTAAAYQKAALDQETVQALWSLQPVPDPKTSAIANVTGSVSCDWVGSVRPRESVRSI